MWRGPNFFLYVSPNRSYSRVPFAPFFRRFLIDLATSKEIPAFTALEASVPFWLNSKNTNFDRRFNFFQTISSLFFMLPKDYIKEKLETRDLPWQVFLVKSFWNGKVLVLEGYLATHAVVGKASCLSDSVPDLPLCTLLASSCQSPLLNYLIYIF